MNQTVVLTYDMNLLDAVDAINKALAWHGLELKWDGEDHDGEERYTLQERNP